MDFIKTTTRLVVIGLMLSVSAFSQTLIVPQEGPAKAGINRSRGLQILKRVKSIIKERYYDKNFKGIDLEASYKETKARIKELEYNWQIFRVIAQFVIQFEDSHTRFYPPGRANQVEYGFTIQMIGNTCYIVDVKQGSDAEAKGLKVGDVVVGIGQYFPTRQNLWKINYLLYALDPVAALDVITADEEGKETKVRINSKFKSIDERRKEAWERRKNKKPPYRCHEVSASIIACRLESFVVKKKVIDSMMKEIEGHDKLVLDLRGNGGGYVYIEQYLVGHFFDRDVKIGDFVTRKKTETRMAKSRGSKVFDGQLTVLIDSNSASAAEVFARIIQLEKRGRIIGDVSAGAVMTSIQRGEWIRRGTFSMQTFSAFGMSVTVADLIMSDGNRLENVGVIPDLAVGPSRFALIERSDPVLSHAVAEFGGELSAEDAGKLNFMLTPPEGERRKEGDDEEDPE